QGGVSRMSPPELASRFHRFPPILDRRTQRKVQGHSRGSVRPSGLPRARCIVTAISRSLRLRWRQRRCGYAIRARRNLPDKEFRYLRTVIVTAAVYWGFDQELRLAADPIN